jgi:hypothetical protein
MNSRVPPASSTSAPPYLANGGAMAAYLAAGIGALAMGTIVILNEAGVWAVPALYAPAGGVSGRTSAAVTVWLVSWVVLHARWRHRDIAPRPVCVFTVVLIVLGLIGTFPPVWRLLP